MEYKTEILKMLENIQTIDYLESIYWFIKVIHNKIMNQESCTGATGRRI